MNTNRLSQKTYLIGIALLTALALSYFAILSATRPASAQTGTFTFTFEGDIDNNADSDASLATISTANGAFSLAIGDLGYVRAAGDVPAWCANVQSHLGATFPFEILAGNHEADGNAARISDYVACLPDRLGVTGVYGSEYYFDYGSARFILVAAGSTVNGINYDYTPGGTHYNWLQARIQEAKAAGKWVIVGDHLNCITVGIKSCLTGQNFDDLVHSEHVDLLIQGHDHNYQRSKQLTCAPANTFNAACVVDSDDLYTRGAGTVTVIDGAGGYRLYNVSATDSERDYFVKAMGGNGWWNFVTGASGNGSSHGVTKVTVSATQLDVQFLPNSSTTFSDSFSIVTGGATATPAPPTNTPTQTNTPIPPTATNTPGGPTNTPTWTATPVPPTNTPTAGPTATPTRTNTPVPPTATPGGSVVMHVATLITTDSAGNPLDVFNAGTTIYWRAQIKDASGGVVSGATVTTTLTRADGNQFGPYTATTDANGWALYSQKSANAWPKGTCSVQVTNVTKTGATYDPAANVGTPHTFTLN